MVCEIIGKQNTHQNKYILNVHFIYYYTFIKNRLEDIYIS